MGLPSEWEKGSQVSCWTNGKGPQVYQKCSSPCNQTTPDVHPLCLEFWKSQGITDTADSKDLGPNKVEVTKGEETTVCYPVVGSGHFGWCTVEGEVETRSKNWGFCSYHCHMTGLLHNNRLMEARIDILSPEQCFSFQEVNMTGLIDFQPKKEVCGGRDITDEQKIVRYTY